ncbi:MAG TPA: CBS domain-containing protein, partial [Burkholderiales bacterium]
QAVLEMSRGALGMTAVVDSNGVVRGVFTDGDLRRAVQNGAEPNALQVDDVMSSEPKTIGPDALAAEAVQLMERHKISQVLVVDERGALVGALNLHDLFRAKVL